MPWRLYFSKIMLNFAFSRKQFFMTDNETKLHPNELAFIALINEYCQMVETASQGTTCSAFVTTMTKLLPRIYISASDLDMNVMTGTEITPALDESTYDQVRQAMAQLLAEDDVYLEVFLADMKYSDTPIAASIAENLADLYQEFYNVLSSIRYATTSDQADMLGLCYENFTDYWGQTLLNVLRALHNIKYTSTDDIQY